MDKFTTGCIVRHNTFGLGLVVRIKPDGIHVFFPSQEGEEAKKFRINAAPLQLADGETDPQLEDLPPFEERADGKFCLPKGRLTQAQALKKFLGIYPLGFEDPLYLSEASGGERGFKIQAHELFEETLGQGQGERLVASGDAAELARRASRVQAKTQVLLHATEAAAFHDGLKEPAKSLAFFAALFDLLATPEPEEFSFTNYLEALFALPQPGTTKLRKWTIATLLPAIAQPDKYIFVKPEIIREAAARLAFDIGYEASPTWSIYRRILKLARRLHTQLAPLGARDYVDVQSFLWVAAKYERPKPAT